MGDGKASQVKGIGTGSASSGGVRDPEDAPPLIEGLLLFGRLLLVSGDAVSDINHRLHAIARAWGAPEAQFILLPSLMMASFDPNKPAHIMSRDLATDHLRMDQVIAVLSLAREAERGEVGPTEAIERLHEIERTRKSLPVPIQILGTTVMTFGMALMVRPDGASIPLYLGLGALVGLLQALAGKVAGLTAIVPVGIAFVVSIVGFLATGNEYDSDSVEVLIPALSILLPGALLTMSAVDLASGEVVSGSSRFLEGMLQLALLAFGIFAAASLVGVQPSTEDLSGSGFVAWTPWLGVLVFALGIALRETAPWKALPWLVVVLYVAHSAQLLGNVLFGPILSGFFGALVIVPLVEYLERFRNAPPAFAIFMPAFLMLVPGALGLLGVSELVATDPASGLQGLVSALSAILSIALGILVGIRLMRIFGVARTARNQLHQTFRPSIRN